MITSTWLIEIVQREKERQIEADRLARLAARIRACCSPSRFSRLARTLRANPAAR